MDYTDWLDTGETLLTAEFSVTPGGGDPALEVDGNSIEGAGKLLTIFINYGIVDVTYTVNVQVSTSGGQVKEDQIVFVVRNQ